MIIEIFGKDFCPYCDKAVRIAQQFIQETEHKYEYKKLEDAKTNPIMKDFFEKAKKFWRN